MKLRKGNPPLDLFRALWKKLSGWLSPSLGDWGERAAEKYLKWQGYKIKARKYRVRGGEADLVAEKDGATVIVEVKTRTSKRFGSAAEAITPTKAKRLKRAAVTYCRANEISLSTMRIDVITIERDGVESKIRHYISAVGAF